MIGLHEIVLRQTKDSPFSYYDGPLDEVIEMLEEHWDERTPGKQEGSWVIKVDPFKFYTGVILLEEGQPVTGACERRSPDEEPYIQLRSEGMKAPANYVMLVVYENRAIGVADDGYTLVTIIASLVENEPMHPQAMMRNQKGLVGGTKAHYTSEEWADAVHYWSNKVMYDRAH